MFDFAIPSAFRSVSPLPRTLEQLWRLEDTGDSVTWFVPADQGISYRRLLPGWMDVQYIPVCPTVTDARNYIHNHYQGADVTVLEDDVPWWVGSRAVWDPRNHGPESPASSPRLYAHEVAALGWAAAQRHGVSAWGCYPVAYSGTQLKPRYGVGVQFLVGHTLGLRIPSGGWPTVWNPIKEDYEISAQACEMSSDGVVRLDAIAAYTKSGMGAGGTSVYRNAKIEYEAASDLIETWPEMFERKEADRNGLPQIAMKGPVEHIELGHEANWEPYNA